MKVQIKQKGKKKSFNVIDKWSDVTLEKWAKLIAIKGFSKIKEAKETILALSDIPEKVLNKLEVYHIAAILQGLSSMQKEETTCLRETIEIEGVDGHLTYSVFSESEQEAHDTVSFFLHSNPFIISKLEKKIIEI